MKLINWISELFKDEKGNPSSKRFVELDLSKGTLKRPLLFTLHNPL